jgi:hypothetical protein
MNFLEELLVGHELKLLSTKVYAHLNYNKCLAHFLMTKNIKKFILTSLTTHVPHSEITMNMRIVHNYLTHNSGLALSKITKNIKSSYLSHTQHLSSSFTDA